MTGPAAWQVLARLRARLQGLPREPVRALPACATAVRRPGAGPRDADTPSCEQFAGRSADPGRLGPEPLLAEQQRDLLEIVEDRYNAGSLIITSQLPIERWYENRRQSDFGRRHPRSDPAQRAPIELKGESLRKQRAAA